MEYDLGQGPKPEDAGPMDGARLRSLLLDANDGIMATAGIVEGFIGAGASRSTLVVAAFASMLAGALALGGKSYGEAAAERDAHLALIEEERRQLALSPEDELDELTALYEAKGLAPELARQVAVSLSDKDPLAAHIEVEHGITMDAVTVRPVAYAVVCGLMFAVGSIVALAAILLLVNRWLVPGTFVAVVLALCLTSWIAARWAHVPLGKTLARNITIGVGAMTITYLVGSLFSVS